MVLFIHQFFAPVTSGFSLREYMNLGVAMCVCVCVNYRCVYECAVRSFILGYMQDEGCDTLVPYAQCSKACTAEYVLISLIDALGNMA